MSVLRLVYRVAGVQQRTSVLGGLSVKTVVSRGDG